MNSIRLWTSMLFISTGQLQTAPVRWHWLMKLAEGGKRTGLTSRELRGNHLSSRLSRKELAGISAFGISAAGTGVGIAGLLGASPVLGGVMTVVGALAFVTSTAITAKKKLTGKKRK